jgi:hypothetical protein
MLLPHYNVTQIIGGKMENKISNNTKKELLRALRARYLKATKKEKTRIINEFILLTGYHRKHVIRLLLEQDNPKKK